MKGLLPYVFPWTASSPDLNLIEGVWRLIKGRINHRIPQPQTNDTMGTAILTEWNALNEDDLGSLLLSMPDRVAAVRSAQGGHTQF